MPQRPNPKLSSNLAKGSKPPKPSDPETVTESEIDHRGGAESFKLPPAKEAVPGVEEDTPDIDAPQSKVPTPTMHVAETLDGPMEPPDDGEFQPPAAGVGSPPTQKQLQAAAQSKVPGSGSPAGQYKGYQDLQSAEEGNLGAPKKIKFVRGSAPGDRPTY